MKEVYAICVSVETLSFGLENASKTTLNAKVNNLGIALSDYNIKFKLIEGVKNTLTDTLSCHTDLDLTKPNSPEKVGHEYGYVAF